MAESADALDSGSSRGQLGGGSSPLIRTKKFRKLQSFRNFFVFFQGVPYPVYKVSPTKDDFFKMKDYYHILSGKTA